jgi:hypothetical protein
MGASAIAYLVGGNEPTAERIAATTDARETGGGYLLVSVVDASDFATLGSIAEQAVAGDRDSCVLFRVEVEPGLGFDRVTASGIELVTVQAPPTAAASVVYLDSSGTEADVRRGLELLGALCAWLATAESPPAGGRVSVVAGTDPARFVAKLLLEHRASAREQVHEDLVAAHREQAALLSDLRLEHDELLIRAAELTRESESLREGNTAAAREHDALRESESSARRELDALQATRLFRYTAGLRRAYAKVRKLGRR